MRITELQTPALLVDTAALEHNLATMADARLHRGPDDAGVRVSPEGPVGLANRRLAIRDLSPGVKTSIAGTIARCVQADPSPRSSITSPA